MTADKDDAHAASPPQSSEQILFTLEFRKGVSRLRTAVLGLSAACVIFIFVPVPVEKIKAGLVEVTGMSRVEFGGLLLVLVGISTLAFAVGAYGDWPRIKETARQRMVLEGGQMLRFWHYY